jgi:hypothetical protein
LTRGGAGGRSGDEDGGCKDLTHVYLSTSKRLG